LTIKQIVVRGGSEHIPKMGDFFLLQMDDFFTEGLCIDYRKGGKGERRFGALPSAKGKAKGRCPVK
jgi:hypothetical protein